MDKMQRSYWGSTTNLHVNYEGCNLIEESNHLKEDRSMFPCCDSNLNFSTANCSEDDSEFGTFKRNKITRQDPMSHRIIEKRRRDRMNNCLADLSRLIPTEYLKKGRGRIEKTEIIEMAIKYMKFLQQDSDQIEQYRLGYQECMSETMRFMVEVEGHFSHEAICVRLLSHLQKHCSDLPHRPAHVPQTVPNSELYLRPPSIERTAIQVPEYQAAKAREEQNNNDVKDDTIYNHNTYLAKSQQQEDNESGQMSYKYKNNIKMRFNQDLNGENEAKRPKLEDSRRSSIGSIESRSMSRSSPSSSEACTRMSDVENNPRTSPSDSSLSSNNPMKHESSNENTNAGSPHEVSPQHSLNVKNLKVPIFMLHAKSSYYIPLTVDYKALSPYMHNYDIPDEISQIQSVMLHPVTINVNFQPNNDNHNEGSKYKCNSRTVWH